MPLTKKLQTFIKDRQWQQADKVADELLALVKDDAQIEAKTEAMPLMERLPAKIQKIQKESPHGSRRPGTRKRPLRSCKNWMNV